MIVIRNIILSDLLEVLNSFPKDTKMVRIEYTKHNKKMVVYASDDDSEDQQTTSSPDDTDDPHISPDEDISDYLD